MTTWPTRSLTARTLPFFFARRRARFSALQQQRAPLRHRHAAPRATRARWRSASAVQSSRSSGSTASSPSRSRPGQRGRAAVGRHGDGHPAPPQSPRAVRARRRRIVDREHEQALGLRRRRHPAIDLGGRRRHHQPNPSEVSRLERTAGDARSSRPPPARRAPARTSGATTAISRARFAQRRDLGRRHRPAAHDQHLPPGELQEQREQRHC